MNRPERKIQDAIVSKLRALGWVVKETHGNMFQQGLPDLYCAHKEYRTRWVEVKNPGGYRFTPAQREFFHQLSAIDVGVWVLISDSDTEIGKLFKPPNWIYYLEVFK